MAAFDRTLAIDPDESTWLWLGKGKVLYTLGRYEEALAVWDRMLEIDLRDRRVLHAKEATLKELGR